LTQFPASAQPGRAQLRKYLKAYQKESLWQRVRHTFDFVYIGRLGALRQRVEINTGGAGTEIGARIKLKHQV
jgi:hypothetical protein